MDENRVSERVSEASEKLGELRDKAENYYAELQDRVSALDVRVREVVKERPLVCVAGAFGVGFLAARILRKVRS